MNFKGLTSKNSSHINTEIQIIKCLYIEIYEEDKIQNAGKVSCKVLCHIYLPKL